MTLEEKLAKFSESLAKETQIRSEKAVEDYEKTLEKNLNEHKEEAIINAELQLQHTRVNYKKEKAKYISTTRLNIKKTMRKKASELNTKLYTEVCEKLEDFKKTPEYVELLKKYIQKVQEYSLDCPFTIFIDKSDEHLIDKIKKYCNQKIKFSLEPIIGGIFAYLPNEKILLNLSFKEKLLELLDNFDWNEEAKND